MTIFMVGGMIGSGKTTARQHLMKRLDARAESTDLFRKHESWANPWIQGQIPLAPEADLVKLAYNMMFYSAIGKGQDPDKLLLAVIAETPKMPFTEIHMERMREYLSQKVADTHEHIVLEAPWKPSFYLGKFYHGIKPNPALIEIVADDSVIRPRLEERANKGDTESLANLKAYLKWLPDWKTMNEHGYHAHEVKNNGSEDEFKKALDDAFYDTLFCHDCRKI
jgi:hypothetical protein